MKTNFNILAVAFLLFLPSFFYANAFFDEFNNQNFLIFTLPRSGTHLLKKCIKLLTEEDFKHTHIDYNFSIKHRDLLYFNKVKMLTIIRDPRDWIVSFFTSKSSRISMDRKLTAALTAFGMFRYNYMIPLHHPDHLRYKKVSDYYNNLLMTWLNNYSDLCVIRFEKLVGPQGGGTKEEQIEEIVKICRFLNINCTIKKIKEISNQLFGNTLTFRRGKFGYWKTYFTEEHKQLFKKDMGEIVATLGYENDLNW